MAAGAPVKDGQIFEYLYICLGRPDSAMSDIYRLGGVVKILLLLGGESETVKDAHGLSVVGDSVGLPVYDQYFFSG